MSIKQNSQFTFKYNKKLGRHGWLRLTPAYSVKMVEQILDNLDYSPACVFEPFSGTGTTELVCANKGITSFAYDINPFLVWLASVKTKKYTDDQISNFNNARYEIAEKVVDAKEYTYPNIYNIERWWHHNQLSFLARLKTCIWSIDDDETRDLLKIALCKTLIALSNAAFNHVSTSFKDSEDDNSFTDETGIECFQSACNVLLMSLQEQPVADAKIYLNNSMSIRNNDRQTFDTLITSPPYPNRISYIRELRPYMYWLGYLTTSEDASDLDWNTIGGTWGSATSKLATWVKRTDLIPNYLFDIAKNISEADNKSASLMANYVLKYFDDIAEHIQSAYDSILPGGTVHYIVGNSNFYGNTVPSEKLYVDILQSVGFTDAKYEIVRKRNCNKALYEFWISAKKPRTK